MQTEKPASPGRSGHQRHTAPRRIHYGRWVSTAVAAAKRLRSRRSRLSRQPLGPWSRPSPSLLESPWSRLQRVSHPHPGQNRWLGPQNHRSPSPRPTALPHRGPSLRLELPPSVSELELRRWSRRCRRRQSAIKAQVSENPRDDVGLGDRSDPPPPRSARRALQHVHRKYARHQLGPAVARTRPTRARRTAHATSLPRVPRHDLATPGSTRGQHTMIGQLVHPRRRNQRRQTLDERKRIKHEMGSAVPERNAQLMHHLALGIQRQTLRRKGRARDIPAKMFQTRSVSSLHPHRRVQREPVNLRAQLLDQDGLPRPRHRRPTQPGDPRTRLWTERHSTLDRSGADQRQQTLLLIVNANVELLLTHQATSPTQAKHSRAYREEQLRHFRAGDAPRTVEDRLGVRVRSSVHAVDEQRVEMKVAVQGRAKSLHLVNRACPAALYSILSRLAGIESENGTQEDPPHRATQARIERQQVAQLPRKRQHPLPNRNLGKYVVDQVRGRFCHPPPATRRAEAATFAGKWNQQVGAAAEAVDAAESRAEHPAGESAAQVPLYPGRQAPRRGVLLDPHHEGLQMIEQHLVQSAALRLSTTILPTMRSARARHAANRDARESERYRLETRDRRIPAG